MAQVTASGCFFAVPIALGTFMGGHPIGIALAVGQKLLFGKTAYGHLHDCLKD